MALEHPIGEHTQQLQDHERRLTTLETAMQTMLVFKSQSEEQSKTIFHILGELKSMLRQYTEDMKTALKELSTAMMVKFEKVDTEIAEIKGRPGRRWDTMVQTLIVGIVSALVGYIVRGLL